MQVRDDLVYGNREFADLTGYESADALSSAGGLGRLFVGSSDTPPGNNDLRIRRADGSVVSVRAHMQRATIAGRSCLVVSFYLPPSISAALVHPHVPDEAETAEETVEVPAEDEPPEVAEQPAAPGERGSSPPAST